MIFQNTQVAHIKQPKRAIFFTSLEFQCLQNLNFS